MISETFSLKEMVDKISSCGFYDMIHKINMEATEAERLIIRHKRDMETDCPEEKYASELKSLINFLRYDVFPVNRNSDNEVFFSNLKRNLDAEVKEKLS